MLWGELDLYLDIVDPITLHNFRPSTNTVKFHENACMNSPKDALIIGQQNAYWLTDATFLYFVRRLDVYAVNYLENKGGIWLEFA